MKLLRMNQERYRSLNEVAAHTLAGLLDQACKDYALTHSPALESWLVICATESIYHQLEKVRCRNDQLSDAKYKYEVESSLQATFAPLIPLGVDIVKALAQRLQADRDICSNRPREAWISSSIKQNATQIRRREQ